MKNKLGGNALIGILTVVEGYILYLSQMCIPKENVGDYPVPFNWELFKHIYPWACDNMVAVAFYSFLVLVMLSVLSFLFQIKRDKRWLKELFKHIINQHFGGETYETRITLYVKCIGARFFFQYVLFAFKQCFKGKFIYLGNLPNPFKQYLRPYVRWSYPENQLSYTYFRAINSEDEKPNGIVEKCYKCGIVISVKNAPYIQGIELTKKRCELSRSDEKLVKQYMKATEMENYNVLRFLQRRANTLYAFPFRKNQENWGVVVIDNLSHEAPLDIETKIAGSIDNYQKIIQLTVKSFEL